MLIADVVFPCPPTAPIISRWTKVFACWDFFIVGILFGNIILGTMQLAWSSTVLTINTLNEFYDLCVDDENAEDEEARSDEAKIGRRKQRVKAMFADVLHPCRMLIFWLRLAPVRLISVWLLERAQMQTPAREATSRAKNERTYPAACDITNPAFSIIIVAQQYYASLLKAESPLYGAFMKYVASYGIDSTWAMHQLRRQVGNASAEIHRRHCRLTKLSLFIVGLQLNRVLTRSVHFSSSSPLPPTFSPVWALSCLVRLEKRVLE